MKISNKNLEYCLTSLNNFTESHPCLTSLWFEYFLNMKRIPNETEIEDCLTAIENMKSLPDINIKQIQAIYGIANILLKK